MSEEAWQIIALYFTGGGYQEGVLRSFAGWTLKSMLNADESIDAAQVLHGGEFTQNKWERALRELVDLGLIEENPDLGERWRLVVKHKKKDKMIQQFNRGDRVIEQSGYYGVGTVVYLNGDPVYQRPWLKYDWPGQVAVEFDREINGEKPCIWCKISELRRMEGE